MKKNRLVAKVKDIEVLAKSLTDETLSLANSVPVKQDLTGGRFLYYSRHS